MSTSPNQFQQLTTFYVGAELFGIEVTKVQEVTGSTFVTPVPLSPMFVCGLVNLRGQIATAISLAELFMQKPSEQNEQMSVVCRHEGSLISLVVDNIGEVVEVNLEGFEKTPETIPTNIRRFISGIYKMNGVLLSVLDTESIFKELSPVGDGATVKSNL